MYPESGRLEHAYRKVTQADRNPPKPSDLFIRRDGMGTTVFLWYTSGKEFKTSNTPVVSTVMNGIKSTLDEKIKDVEDMIKF